MSDPAGPVARRALRWPLAALHLVALWSFAFVQPLFDLLSHNADFFIARGNTAGDILGFAFLIVLVPPAILVGAEALAARVSRRGARGLHLALVALLSGAFALQLLKRVIEAGGGVLLAAAGAVGVAFAAAYARTGSVRSFVTVLAAAPVVFVALFLVFSPVSELLRPERSLPAAATGPPSRTPVVIAILDELPTISLMAGPRRIDAERYPGFARLARESTWYRNATTVSDSTTRAVPAILTGLRSDAEQRLPTSRAYPRSVFTLLGRRWDQHVLEPVTDVCPPDICKEGPGDSTGARIGSLASDLSVVTGHIVLPEDLARSLPPIDRGWADFAAGDRFLDRRLGTEAPEEPRGDWWAQNIAGAQRSLRAIGPASRRPPLHLIHFVAPHVPWRFLPSGLRYPEPGPGVIPGVIPGEGWGDDPELVRQGLQRHLLQVSFTDRLIGEMITRLERARLWDRALVVVVADHGASFRRGQARRPVTRSNFPDVAGVPLFVKLPGQRSGRVDDRAARTIDILPTIARAVGAGRGWRFDGTPLGAVPRDATLRVTNEDQRRDVTVALREFVRARDAQLAWQLRVFPPGRGSLYRLGPTPELIGRRVSSLPRARAGKGGSIDRAEAYGNVDPASGVVPAFVTGRLAPGERAGVALAVAVDGRIRAVSRSWRQGGGTRFSAIVPPSALPAGAHAVEVFAVGPGSTLRSVARTAD